MREDKRERGERDRKWGVEALTHKIDGIIKSVGLRSMRG